MAFEQWPYTNLHDLNLDWILEQLKKFQNTLNDFENHFPHISEKNNGNWDPFNSYEQNEIVVYENGIYIAKKYVPYGTPPTNTDYWLLVASVGEDIVEFEERIAALEADKRFIFPEEFGAVGDGVADDTVALNNWSKAIVKDNRIPSLGGGTYLITAPLHIYADGERHVYMNGSTIKNSVRNADDAVIVGEMLEADPFESNVSLIGPGTIDCNNSARTGLRLTSYVHNAIFDNLFIPKVHLYGVYGEGEASRKNKFSNITIWGPFTLENETDTYGFYLNSWDHIFNNIVTLSVAHGIYAAGGVLLTNYHHWTNVSKYTTKAAYSQTYGISTFRGQFSNLYIDAFNGVIASGYNATLQINNLHIEAAGVDYISDNRFPWLDEIRAVYMHASAMVTLNNLYFAPHGGPKTTLIPVYATNTTGHVPQTSGLQMTDYARVSGYQYMWYLATVSEGNNIYIVNKPVSLLYRALNIRKDSGRYLLGYIRDCMNYYGVERFSLSICNNTFKISINGGNNPQVISVSGEGRTCNYGRLVVGQSVAINNIQVKPLYIEPGYNGGALPVYTAMEIAPEGFNGVAGLYPVLGRDIGTMEESDTSDSVLSIPLIIE